MVDNERMNTNTTTKGQTMYRIKDAQTGTTLAERTSAENVLSWLEAQGETIGTATGLLETAKQGIQVRCGMITVEAI